LRVVAGIGVNVNSMPHMPTKNRAIGCDDISFKSNGT
jgi:hypothetical protein